jgi:hypothetical protein
VDLAFDVVAAAPGGPSIVFGPIDGVRFAQGFVSLATRQLWWPDSAREGTPHGLRAMAVVAHVRAEAAAPAPPTPSRAPVTPPNVLRLLPNAAGGYPTVKWRLASAH